MDFLTAISPEEKKASFLKNLRSATAPKHTALESNELLSSLTSESLTIPKYYYYLVLMRAVEQAYTKMLDNSPLVAGISGKVNSAPLIEQDILAIMPAACVAETPLPYELSSENVSPAFMLAFLM